MKATEQKHHSQPRRAMRRLTGRVTHAVLALIMLVLVPAAGIAGSSCLDWDEDQANYYELLIDTDGNLATGGTVTVVQAGEAPHDELGIDFIARVLTGCDGVDLLHQRVAHFSWNGVAFEVFEGPIALPYPVGIGNGVDGTDVIEWDAVLSAVSNGCIRRALFHASIVGADFNDYTDEFSIGNCASPTEVPTLGGMARVVLPCLLAISGLLFVRRTVGTSALSLLVCIGFLGLAATVLHAMAITLDGEVGDWGADPPVVEDPIFDQSSPYTSEDLIACFARAEVPDDRLYLRCDVQNAMDFPTED